MGHPGDSDELIEILDNELGIVVRYNPGLGFLVFIIGSFEDYFDICVSHLFFDLPMDDEATTAVKKAAQIVEGAIDVEIRDVHIPMFMGTQRLIKFGSFQRCFFIRIFISVLHSSSPRLICPGPRHQWQIRVDAAGHL